MDYILKHFLFAVHITIIIHIRIVLFHQRMALFIALCPFITCYILLFSLMDILVTIFHFYTATRNGWFGIWRITIFLLDIGYVHIITTDCISIFLWVYARTETLLLLLLLIFSIYFVHLSLLFLTLYQHQLRLIHHQSLLLLLLRQFIF